MQKLRAYIRGMVEFRRSITTHYDYPLIEHYDAGRERAHRLTRRRWDQE